MLTELPGKTVKLLKSTQVIVSISSIVKELIENSLDAGASSIVVRLYDYGFEKIEVKDNGSGIAEDDMPYVAKPHFTSKIECFEDIESLTSYGFRGEALSSLCTVSDVSIITKYDNSDISYNYKFSSNGDITDKMPTAATKGTCVYIKNLFKSVPVRRQFYRTISRKREELKKIEEHIFAWSLIKPEIYISLSHDGCNIYTKQPEVSISKCLYVVFKEGATKLRHISIVKEELQMDVWLPDKAHILENVCSRVSTDRLFIFANNRTIRHNKIEKTVKASYSQNLEGCHGKYPIGVIMIHCPSNELDINLEPSKMKIMFKKEELLLSCLEDILQQLYGTHDVAKKPSELPCTISFQTQHSSLVNLSPDKKTLQKNNIKEHSTNKPNTNSTQINSLRVNLSPENKISKKSNIKEYLVNKPITPIIDQSCEDNSFLRDINNVQSSTLIEQVNVEPFNNNGLKSFDNLKQPNNEEKEPKLVNSIFDLSDDDEIFQIPFPNLPEKNTEKENREVSTENVKSVLNPGENNCQEILKENFKSVPPNHCDVIGTLSWGRGTALDKQGSVQPVSMLLGNPEPTTKRNISQSPPIKRAKKDPFKHREVFSPQGMKLKKPDSGFSLFAKEIRHEILSEHPGKDFTLVAQEIAKRWKELTDEGKENYNKKSSAMKQDFVKNMQSPRNKAILSLSDVSINRSFDSDPLKKLVAPTTPILVRKTIQPVVHSKPWQKHSMKINFSIDMFKSPRVEMSKNSDGLYKFSKGWLSLENGILHALNPWRLNEVLLRHKMMSSISVPVTKFDSPIPFNKSVIGEVQWNALLEMRRERHTANRIYQVKDHRITFNGLQVSLYENDGGMITHGEIDGMTEVMPYYGIHDLTNVLAKVSKTPNCSLEQSRPIKLITWIQGEVVRMQRESPFNGNKDDIQEKLEQWDYLTTQDTYYSQCFHSKSIKEFICNLDGNICKRNIP